MTTKEQEPERIKDRSDQQRLEAGISRQVLDLLGRPLDPHWARVRHLWDGQYRVNVMIGESAVFAAIAHSYFVKIDGSGNIVDSSPSIKKLY